MVLVKVRDIVIILFIFFTLNATFADTTPFNASFDCTKATTEIEKSICGSKALSNADAELGMIYKNLILNLPAAEKKRLRSEQIEWIRVRNSSCQNPKKNEDCVLALYTGRIDALKKMTSSAGERSRQIITKGDRKLLSNAQFSDSSFLIREVKMPETGTVNKLVPGLNSPLILVGDNLLVYQNGQRGPIEAFNPVTFDRKWVLPINDDEVYPLLLDNDIILFEVHNLGRSTADLYEVSTYNASFKWKKRLGLAYGRYRGRNFVALENIIVIATWDTVQAFDKVTGQALWDFQYDYSLDKITARTTGTYYQNRSPKPIYWGVGSNVYAIDAYTGTILWSIIIDKVARHIKSSGVADGDTGLGNEIITDDSSVLLFSFSAKHTEATLFAIDVQTKKVIWELTTFSLSSFVREGSNVFVAKSDGVNNQGIYCFDLKTGKEKWKHPMPHPDMTPCTAADNVLYCNDHWFSDRVEQTGTYAIDKSSGASIWQYISTGRFVYSPIVYGNRVYTVSPEKGEGDHNGIIRVFDHQKTSSRTSSTGR